jgi:uncharacterized protein (TIGR03437 family)
MSTHYQKYCSVIVLLTIALSSAAWADQSGSVTLGPNDSFNLDSGNVSRAGGDVLWNGTELTPQGRAGLYNLGKKGSRVYKFIPARSASAAPYNAAPIPASSLVAGDVFGVRTNGGNYAKVIVTAASGAYLSLQYTTFVAARSTSVKPTAAAGPPVITLLQNNYSYLQPGVPNYGIAPGSLFVIIGTGLSTASPAVLQSSAPPGLPQTLNQTSVSVTVGGVTTTPTLYYTSATQLAAVLPSTTPAGSGTITVTYQGTTSAKFPIQVVPSALGLDTLYGSGTGSGIATDSNGNVLGLTNSAMPGQEIVLWGSGVGADTANDDQTYPQKQDNLTNIPLQVYIGGIAANVSYRGRSQYPGVDQINVTIPGNVSPGCYVSVVAQSGSVVSNAVTISVTPGGGPCTDPGLGYTGTQLQALAANGNTPVNGAAFTIAQFTGGNGTGVLAAAGFTAFNSATFGAGYTYASPGSCTVAAPGFSFNELGSGIALDPGTVQVTGPAGTQALEPQGAGGLYAAQFQGSLTPGTYTFTTSGGKDVKALNVAINVSAPFTLTNQAALGTITRSQGATVTWTGGFPNGLVLVSGLSPSPAGSVSFYCYGLSSAGQLTIPPSILLALPPGSDKLSIINVAAPQSFAGVNFSLAMALAEFEMTINYK